MKRKLIGAAALLMTSGVANADDVDDVDDMYKAMTYPMLAQFRWAPLMMVPALQSTSELLPYQIGQFP